MDQCAWSNQESTIEVYHTLLTKMVVDNLNHLMDVEYCCSRIVMFASIDKQALHSLIILSLVKSDMLVSIMIRPQLLGSHMFSNIISPIGGTHTRDCNEMGGIACECRHTHSKMQTPKGLGFKSFVCSVFSFVVLVIGIVATRKTYENRDASPSAFTYKLVASWNTQDGLCKNSHVRNLVHVIIDRLLYTKLHQNS